MEIDFNQPMRTPYGKPVFQDDGLTPMLLGHICVNALTGGVQGDKRSAAEKIACWKLATERIVNSGGLPNQDGAPEFKTADLKAKDIATIQELVEKVYTSPLVYAQVCGMLEPEKEGGEDG